MTIIIASVTALVLMAIAEYSFHRWLMHRPHGSIYFTEHAIEHHAHNRLDINLDLPVWTSLKVSLPTALVILFIWWQLSVAIICVSVCHALIWTSLHRSFHGFGYKWMAWYPFYGLLKKHHEQHHAHPKKNFGAVFGPVVDIAFFTHYKNGKL